MIQELKTFLHNQISAFSKKKFNTYPPPAFTMHLDDFVEGIRNGQITISNDEVIPLGGLFDLLDFDIQTPGMALHNRKMEEYVAYRKKMQDTSRALDDIVNVVLPLLLGDGRDTLLSMLTPEHRTRVENSITLLGDTLHSVNSRDELLPMLTDEHKDTMSKFLDTIRFEKEELPNVVYDYIKQRSDKIQRGLIDES
jgi:hypothetical protein